MNPTEAPHTGSHTLLDPKNDYVFKKLFVGAPALLAALINAVRPNERPVTVIEVLNPNITPEDLAGKFIVLDILVEDDRGLLYNIEMQVRRYKAYSARSTYYLAHALIGQLGGGQDYHLLKGVIGIHLLDYELFNGPEQQTQAVWCFEMRDRLQPDVKLGDELQLNIIEMRKADRLKLASHELADLLTFFEHWQEETTMNQMTSAPIQQAMAQLRALSADTATRQTAWNRERALISEITERRAEREEGRQEGRQEGTLETKITMLEKLLSKRFSPLPEGTLERINRATPEQLEHWILAVIDAPTLEAVFVEH
jgi:predicted transposase/invertase (TIGR01784 family)